jgi:nucleoside-diphosphate-sugar epimerase
MNEVDVVFGSSGFVGTHLIRRLRHNGRMVVAIDIRPPRETLDGVDYLVGDVRDLRDLQLTQAVGTVYNLAAVHTTPGHPTNEYYETNVAGALEVTQFAERHQAGDIVFTSSISVYGPSEETKREDSAPNPVSAYGCSKLLAERVHEHWLTRNPAAKLVVVRPAVVFGAGEGGNFTRLAKLLKKGIFIYPGRKDTIKACIYVEDLLRAMEFARGSSESYTLFNGAYPNRFTLQQIVDTMINDHFPGVRTYMIPAWAVRIAASILGRLKFMNIGLHPERVTKLVRSTDIYPAWLTSKGFDFPISLQAVMQRWKSDTAGTFV